MTACDRVGNITSSTQHEHTQWLIYNGADMIWNDVTPYYTQRPVKQVDCPWNVPCVFCIIFVMTDAINTIVLFDDDLS